MDEEVKHDRLPTLAQIGIALEGRNGKRPERQRKGYSKQFFDDLGRSSDPGLPKPVGKGLYPEESSETGIESRSGKAGEKAEGGRICPACGQISDTLRRQEAFAEFGRIGREAAVNSRTNRKEAYEKYNEEILTHQELLVRGGVFASAKDVVEALRKISDVSGNAKATPQDVGRDLDRVGDWLNDGEEAVQEEAAEPEIEDAT